MLHGIVNYILEMRIQYLRGKAYHLRALAEDYKAQSQHCRSDAHLTEQRIAQLECRRLLSKKARRDMLKEVAWPRR